MVGGGAQHELFGVEVDEGVEEDVGRVSPQLT